MALIEMVMPKMGESIIEATVIRWLKKEGDKIDRDESVLEVATDKVDTEVPASSEGILHKILIPDGQVAQVGTPIALIDNNQVASASDAQYEQDSKAISDEMEKVEATYINTEKNIVIGRFYSPLVLNIAREENIAMQELERITGTGKDARVTKHDILHYISVKNKEVKLKESIKENTPPKVEFTPQNKPLEHATISKAEPVIKPTVSFSGEHEIIEMDWMRKIIAQRMIDSQRISATVTSFVEADVTDMVFWRNKMKHDLMKREGEPLTFTPLLVEAIARALKDFPLLNSSLLEGDKIMVKKDINIGLAVALPDGNLIVPIIKNADRYNIGGLTKYINETIKKARNNKLKADDLADGTFTLSNIGSFGNVMGTPVIVQPQVGIIAAGAIRKKPAVIETQYGDTIGIRHFMFLSHSYDHRIIDGALGGAFVRKVADYLEGFDTNRKI